MPTPPGSATLEQHLLLMQKQIDDLTRQPPPPVPPPPPPPPGCVVTLSTDISLAAGATHQARSGWVSYDDATSMFTPGTSSPCFITIAKTGIYLLHYHCAVSSPVLNAFVRCAINRNSPADGYSVATDTAAPKAAGEAPQLNALRSRLPLSAGDTLYWSNYSAAAATLQSAEYSVPASITVQYIADA